MSEISLDQEADLAFSKALANVGLKERIFETYIKRVTNESMTNKELADAVDYLYDRLKE